MDQAARHRSCCRATLPGGWGAAQSTEAPLLTAVAVSSHGHRAGHGAAPDTHPGCWGWRHARIPPKQLPVEDELGLEDELCLEDEVGFEPIPAVCFTSRAGGLAVPAEGPAPSLGVAKPSAAGRERRRFTQNLLPSVKKGGAVRQWAPQTPAPRCPVSTGCPGTVLGVPQHQGTG